MSSDANPPLTPSGAIPHALGPLAQSYTYDGLEADMKEVFMEVFEALIRPRLTEVNTLGMPHRAPFSVATQAVKLEGLAVEREQAAEAYTRELLRAWRARNPKRGLHFLTHYLQMLWPGQWEAHQLWHPVAGVAYPQGVTRAKRPGHFLTSRVMVAVDVDDPTGVELLKMRGSFRTVLAARLVILMALLRRFQNTQDSGRPVRLAASSDALQLYGIDAVYASAKKGGVSFPPIDPGPQGAVISGRVWLDANSDGLMAGESGVEGANVSIGGDDGIVAGTATTDANGDYSITVDPLFDWYGMSYRVFFGAYGYTFVETLGADNDIETGTGGENSGNSGYFTLLAGGSYTANAAVAAPPAPSNLVLSLAFDGTEGATTTTDSGPLAQVVTLHSMSLSTAGPQSGTACAVATGAAFTRAEVAAHASMVFGTQDFSVSGWVDADATQPRAYPVLFATFDPSASSNWTPGALSVCASRAEYPGKVVVFCYNYSSSTPMLVSTSSLLGAGWVKWELRRVGNTVSLLVADSVEATQTFSGAISSSAQPYFFGGDSNAAANPAVALSGKLDNCIVTIG